MLLPIGMKEKVREKKYFGRFKDPLTPIPNLVETQLATFKWLTETGLKEICEEC